jgi:hypothetical protein
MDSKEGGGSSISARCLALGIMARPRSPLREAGKGVGFREATNQTPASQLPCMQSIGNDDTITTAIRELGGRGYDE